MTPGWDSPAYVSCLARALRHDSDLGEGLLELAAFMKKNRCKIERNCSKKEAAIQKQLYSILIGKIPNGWNPPVSKRLAAFGIDAVGVGQMSQSYANKSVCLWQTFCVGTVWHKHEAFALTDVSDSDLIHNSFEFFGLKLQKIQPHLGMLFGKTIVNGWHMSSRMHEAICLPCIFGCNSLPTNSLASISSTLPNSSTKDETGYYLNCPIL